eukprot:gene13216-17715_t
MVNLNCLSVGTTQSAIHSFKHYGFVIFRLNPCSNIPYKLTSTTTDTFKSFINIAYSPLKLHHEHAGSVQCLSLTKINSANYSLVASISNQRINYNALREEIMNYYDELSPSWKYRIWRYFFHVTSSDKRHSIPLPLTNQMNQELCSIVHSIHPFLSSQLHQTSSLIELNAIISLPGSEKQEIHSDVPYSNSNDIISCFVALDVVTLNNGPTCLYPRSHEKIFHKSCKMESLNRYYSSDGVEEIGDHSDGSDRSNNSDNQVKNNIDIIKYEEESQNRYVNNSLSLSPIYATLQPGDILIFDTRLFHLGAANQSDIPRPLLSFSFQNRNIDGNIDRVQGFTYHCHDSVKNRLNLEDFANSKNNKHS